MRSRAERATNIWPGFVDALATLLLVITFLLAVFILAYFFISQALSGRDEALERLSRQVSELADLLALEQQANAELRLNVAQLSASLQKSTEEREILGLRISELTERAERAEASLAEAETSLAAWRDELTRSREDLTKSREELAASRKELAEARKALAISKETLVESERKIAADRETIELRLREIESLRRDLAALKKVRADLEAQVGELTAALEGRDEEIGALRDRRTELEAEFADQEERTLLAQKEVEERDIRLSELLDMYEQVDKDLASERELSKKAQAQVALLNQQIAALRDQLSRIEAALEAAEQKDKEKEVVIADLGRRLNVALASKVEELSRYRSEFFGRLREVLGERPNIHVVGDRFVFQSEVLFDTGSAELGQQGKEQLAALARTLLGISKDIPSQINWILQVEGHTDRIPIATARFPSNWELSTARALSVAHFLIDEGVPPTRVAAAGFGEYQPLDARDDEIAFRRNRRIELKLTQR